MATDVCVVAMKGGWIEIWMGEGGPSTADGSEERTGVLRLDLRLSAILHREHT